MMLQYYTRVGSVALALTAVPATLSADAPRVVADIAPVHGLVAQVMEGVGTPEVLLPQGASPHGFSLRPSQVRALADADVIFTIGEGLSPWLMETAEGVAPDAHLIELLEWPGTLTLPFRESVVCSAALWFRPS